MQYTSLHGDWGELVDSLNDKFNYTMALPMAKVLASCFPGAQVVSFSMPSDWQRVEGDRDARRFAFAWLPSPGETSLHAGSRILTVSGEMLAGSWASEERYLLANSTVSSPDHDGGYCHRVLRGIVSRLPWMRDVFPEAPAAWEWLELCFLLEEVQDILSAPGSSCTIETIALDESWRDLAQQSRFAFEDNARTLDAGTPQASVCAPRSRRV